MSGLVKKRSREYEPSQDSPKRFHGETEEQILHLLEDSECLDKTQSQQECCAIEELVSGVMRTLQEEIGLTCSSSYDASCGFSDPSRDDSVSSDVARVHGTAEGGIDLCYLLGASDDELGIPPSPVVDVEDQPAFSSEEGSSSALDFVENPELKSFVDNWQFEDDFVDLTQFTVFEDTAAGALDFMNWAAFIDGDYPTPWRVETAFDMY